MADKTLKSITFPGLSDTYIIPDTDIVAETYSSGSLYAVGDYCIYNNALYRCSTAITTAEAWTAGHWTAVAMANEVSQLNADLTELDDRTFAIASSNIINPADIEGKGVWWYNGTRYTTGNATTNASRSAKIYVKPNTTYHFGLYKIADNTRKVGYGYNYFNPFKADGTFISGVSGSNDFTTGEDWAYVIITYTAYVDDVLTYAPMCSADALPTYYEEYQEVTADYILDTFDKKRSTMYITSASNDTAFFLKMYEAFLQGNTDVFVEKATYTLSETYNYITDTLGWTWAVGVPIGNGCRYYFNDATIISNPPEDNYSQSRNILDSQTMGSDFEIHDVTLINNGGRYCVHDEGNNSTNPYCHKYENVRMYYNKTELTPDTGSKPFGCGTGFNTSFVFDGCVFAQDSTQVSPSIAIHGPTTNPNNDPTTLHIIMKNCYVNSGFIYVNDDTFAAGSTLEFFLFGNKTETTFSDSLVNAIENNNTLIS